MLGDYNIFIKDHKIRRVANSLKPKHLIHFFLAQSDSRAKIFSKNMSNLLKFYQINSFTTKPLTGNPAGVILCQETWPENIQKIASEINQNETAFILPIKNSNSNFEENAFKVDKKFKLRWLTPTCEVPLCGHATLGAASVLFEVFKNENQVLEFETLSGILKAERDDKNNNTGIILDFPADVPVALEDLDSINHIIPYVKNSIIPACGDFDQRDRRWQKGDIFCGQLILLVKLIPL